jgi:hypothetical protein
MIKMLSKIMLLTLFACCLSFIAKAQIGYDYSLYDIGVSAGFNTVSGDVLHTKTKPSVNFNFTYNPTPFTNIVFEAQLGRFAGGDSTKAPGEQFTSSFSAYILRGQFQLGEFVDYSSSPFLNGVKNLYVSAGVGYLVNHISAISRTPSQYPDVYFPGKDNIMAPFVPLRIGYEFKIFNRYQQPSFKVDLGYEYNYVFNDNVDGYALGKSKDIYTQFSIGVKFAIGGNILSYKKQIQY